MLHDKKYPAAKYGLFIAYIMYPFKTCNVLSALHKYIMTLWSVQPVNVYCDVS